MPDKLDGIRPMKRRREESPPFLPSDDDDPYDEREEDMRIGKKRVSSDCDFVQNIFEDVN